MNEKSRKGRVCNPAWLPSTGIAIANKPANRLSSQCEHARAMYIPRRAFCTLVEYM